jgi:hypothetical protein
VETGSPSGNATNKELDRFRDSKKSEMIRSPHRPDSKWGEGGPEALIRLFRRALEATKTWKIGLRARFFCQVSEKALE